MRNHDAHTLYYTHLFSCSLTQTANQPITWQQLQTTCSSSNRASEEGLKQIFTKPSLGFTENGRKKEKLPSERRLWRRMDRLVWDDKGNSDPNDHRLQPKHAEYYLWSHSTWNIEDTATAAEDPTRCHLSAKNRKLRLQFTQAHQNWTTED